MKFLPISYYFPHWLQGNLLTSEGNVWMCWCFGHLGQTSILCILTFTVCPIENNVNLQDMAIPTHLYTGPRSKSVHFLDIF